MTSAVFKIVIPAAMVLFYSLVGAQADKPSEYKLKAVFLYNFAYFIEWPEEAFADSTAPLIIAVLGQDPFGDILKEVVKGETVGKHKIEIRNWSTLNDAESCHILFTTTEKWTDLEKIFRKLKGTSVLTVGEADSFIELGGAIGLVKDNNRIRFEINMAAAERAKLRVSSKLQSVAKRIIRK